MRDERDDDTVFGDRTIRSVAIVVGVVVAAVVVLAVLGMLVVGLRG